MVPQLISYITQEYSVAHEEERAMCQNILETVAKGGEWEIVAKSLVSCTHNYESECPKLPNKFVRWQKQKDNTKDVNPIGLQQRNAFRLALAMIRRHNKAFEPYMARLLQNAAVGFLDDPHYRDVDIIRDLAKGFEITDKLKLRPQSSIATPGWFVCFFLFFFLFVVVWYLICDTIKI